MGNSKDGLPKSCILEELLWLCGPQVINRQKMRKEKKKKKKRKRKRKKKKKNEMKQ